MNTYPHAIASCKLLNDFGRLLKKLCILANDSIAEPSTTSITTKPIIGKSDSVIEATFTATAPPRLWPIKTIDGILSRYDLRNKLMTSLKFILIY